MRFGLFLQPVHPPTSHPTVALERDLELVELLDRLGYDEVWVGEHHSTGWENIGAPDLFIAAAAERTRHIGFGTGVIQLGLHHPLVLLDRMIFLDHLTRGRVTFGVGVGGGLPSDLAVFGLTKEDAGRRFDESLGAMVRLLESDEPVDEKTDWFELHSASLQLAPFTRPHLPFAVASTNQRNVESIGRLGGRVLTGPVPDHVPGIVEALQRGARSVGREASHRQVALSYAMHLAETEVEAVEAIREGAIAEHYDFNIGVNGAPVPEAGPEDWFRQFVSRQFIGTPEGAVERIEQILDVSGGVGGILFTSRDWADPDASRASWELFAKKVAPRFQGRLDHQDRASVAAARLNRGTAR